jgi:hypothetical protein
MMKSSNSYTLFSFLELLSVKRVKEFIFELGMEIEAESYDKVVSFARACLEVYIHAAMCKGLRDSTDLQPMWKRYRASNGFLDDYELAIKSQEIMNCDSHKALSILYSGCQDILKSSDKIAVDKWFKDIYIPSQNGIRALVLAIFKLTHPASQFIADSKMLPLTAEERKLVNQFCDAYYDKQADIDKRFTLFHDEAVREGPSRWEAVLQTFPADGKAGSNYPWLYDICGCLIFRMFLAEVEALKKILGPSTANRFVEWLRFEADRSLGEKDLPLDVIG